MPGLLVAAAVAATLSATPPAHRADVKPRLRTSAQLTTSLATDTTSIRKVCGMPMVIGDASVDRGILIDPSGRHRAAIRAAAP